MHTKSVFLRLLTDWVKTRVAPAQAVLMLSMTLLLATACVGAQSSHPDFMRPDRPEGESPLRVVTTIPILADLARNVGGDRVEVQSLVPPGADVHSFQTTPDDSVNIAGASVVITNGAGLDDFLLPVLLGALRDSAVLVVTSQGVAENGLGNSRDDPHFWLDPVLAIHYVEQIRDGLIQADQGNAAAYRERARQYTVRLKDLDSEISRILDQVPPDNRRLVSYHRAFSHLGRRYGWATDSLVAGDGVAVTPSDILRLTQVIKANGVPVVFAEPQLATSVLEAAAHEAQAAVAPIHAGLASQGPSSYIEMMRFNAQSLAENLR